MGFAGGAGSHVLLVRQCVMHACHLTDSVQRRSGTSRADEPRGQTSEASPESPPASRWTRNPRH